VSAPEVGVLLPVRLETRFVAPQDGGTWRLRVRVVPDAVAVSTHDPVPSAVELDAATAMWRAAGGTDLDTAEGRRAWRGLAAAVGVERAAWLARTFPPVTGPDGEVTVDRPDQPREQMRRSRLLGLPPTVELWLARGGQLPARAAVLEVLADQIDLDFTDPDGPRDPWWSSFGEALRVGMAAELDLGTGHPDDIDVLYAVGLGGGDPGPLLSAQADSGRLGLLAPGSPTTSIDGQPAASLGDDVQERRALLAAGVAGQPGTQVVTRTLAGSGATLPALPGGAADHRPLNRALMGTLWPALWGHSLGNVLGYDRQVDLLGLWAAENVVPEGPLPVLRVGAQPYGLLPATSLAAWREAPGDPAIETELVPLVRELVARWAAAAEDAAIETGRRPFELVLRTPAAARYVWRWLVPVEVAHAVAFRYGNAMRGEEVRRWWERRAASTPRMGDAAVPPSTRLVSVGWGHDVELRLLDNDQVSPVDSSPTGLRGLRRASVPDLLRTPATTLLGELARHAVLAGAAAVARTAAHQPRAIVEPPSADADAPAEVDTWALRFRPADLDNQTGPTAAVLRNVLGGLDTLAELPAAEVERGLRATLDTATHRIDPWATGIAWRRLQALATAPRTLGVYGWVDTPRPRSTSPSSEYILAPSADQATVAALLRDRALRDPDADRWQLDLTSDRIRGALRLATEAREGSHPAESLGRAVEQIVANPNLIDLLRTTFPLLPSLTRQRLRVRRVCNGVAVLAAAVDEPARLAQLGLSAAQLDALGALAAHVDALGDLHVADAVYGLVRGRTADVAATTAAAAGVGIPSALDVVRTPRTGRSVTSVALLVLPVPVSPSGPDTGPVAMADAAAASYLDARAGDPEGPDWTWTTLDAAGAAAGSVTLAAAGMRPSDTIGLGADNLSQAVRDLTGVANLAPGPVPGHDRVRAIAAALTGLPAMPEDVGDTPTAADAEVTLAELRDRLAALRAAAANDVTGLLAVAGPGGSTDDRRAGMRTAARWGITPLATAGADPDALGAELAVRLERAADVLGRRLAATADETMVADLTAAGLAEQIAGLAAPEGACPVFGRLDAALCAGLLPDTQGPPLDPDWLETVAPVRRSLARLEALQLDERLRADGAPMAAWTSRPDDPWQRIAPRGPNDVPLPTRLVAAFGPVGVLPASAGSTVAVALMDRFVETIPDREQDSAVAFRHDLPAARAPQAVLLAVPPDVDQPLSPGTLVDIVSETRQLARARVADPAQLGPATGILHLAAVSSVGRSGVQLERE
jgi:hypothetical protein